MIPLALFSARVPFEPQISLPGNWLSTLGRGYANRPLGLKSCLESLQT